MKLKKEVTLNEKDVREIIIKSVEKNTGMHISKLIFLTGVRGDYDMGDAEEYVREIICEME